MEPSQKEKLKADLTEYNRLEKELFDFKKRVNDFLKLYVEDNRNFANGEQVAIISRDTGDFIGFGIVEYATVRVSFEAIDVKYYIKDWSRLDLDLHIIYNVKAMKKDGKASAKTFSTQQRNISENGKFGDFWIRKADKY
jgi:hypothetical protein